ncbi:MAG: T9SS type A sorting domain-containing protein [Bacteroidota bacterium]
MLALHSVAQFAPPVGQTGTTSMYKDSSAFVAWATGCTSVRGYQDISNTSLGYASTGADSMALGAAGSNGTLSLGDGGSAVLTFSLPIKDGLGFDFAVFENSFSDTFLELAFVEVSSDGANFFRFPAISNTQDTVQVGSFGSVDATLVDNLAGKYRALYGTPFDLSELPSQAGLDVSHITHVKIIDVVGCIQNAYATYDSNNKKVNDPWNTPFASGGFDLDAVGVIHQQTTNVKEINTIASVSVFPNPIGTNITVSCYLREGNSLKFIITDVTGRMLKIINNGVRPQGWNSLTVDMEDLSSGIYFLQLKTSEVTIIEKLFKQ